MLLSYEILLQEHKLALIRLKTILKNKYLELILIPIKHKLPFVIIIQMKKK